MNQRSQAELNRVRLPEPEPEIDPQLFVDPELAGKRPRERQKRSSFNFVQAGKLQRQAEVQRLRVRGDGVQAFLDPQPVVSLHGFGPMGRPANAPSLRALLC